MASQVLELPKGVRAPVEIGSLGAFYETSSSSDEVLEAREERLISNLLESVTRYVLGAISARTVAEFRNERRKAWPKYVRALRALHDTFVNLVPEEVIASVSRQAMRDLEADIEKRGVAVFGETLTEQALFTLFTVGEIRALAKDLMNAEVPPEKRAEDLELLQEYHQDSLWAQFHLDGLIAAIRFNRYVAEEIRADVCEGLRAAVNAYAIMKDAAALRRPSVEEPPVANLPWDEEDERLLASSMRDANADFSEDC